MNEHLPSPTDNEHKQETRLMSRRRAVTGAAALAIMAGVGNFGINKLRTSEDNIPNNDPSPIDTSPASIETPTDPEYEQNATVPLGNAELIRQDFENMTSEVFSEQYNLTTENAKTPTDVANVMATRVTDIASIGCNPIEITSGTIPEAYLFAIAGLSGIKAEDVVAEEVEGSYLYKVISELRAVVIEHYAKAVEDGSSAGMTFAVKYVGDIDGAVQSTSNRGGEGKHGIKLELEAVITAPGAEPVILPASFWLDFTVPNVEPGETYLTSGPRVMEIVLKEVLTKPFREIKQ